MEPRTARAAVYGGTGGDGQPDDPLRHVGRLLIRCPDRPGIVAAVSRILFEQGANIVDSHQHSTSHENGTFFMRVEFSLHNLEALQARLEAAFGGIAARFEMDWRLTLAARRKRIAILVSRAQHALLELLWAQRAGDLRADVALVMSNHPDVADTVGGMGIPFHHVPVHPARKQAAEEAQLALLAGYQADLVVLARYMQILSPRFIGQFPGRIINIHHSFLPAFVGADPYARAQERGVKLIGATAHYVTEDLDAGPIIEQDVQRVDHRHSVADLRRIGRHIERVVLARAVAWHTEDRVLLDGNKTVVFA